MCMPIFCYMVLPIPRQKRYRIQMTLICAVVFECNICKCYFPIYEKYCGCFPYEMNVSGCSIAMWCRDDEILLRHFHIYIIFVLQNKNGATHLPPSRAQHSTTLPSIWCWAVNVYLYKISPSRSLSLFLASPTVILSIIFPKRSMPSRGVCIFT